MFLPSFRPSVTAGIVSKFRSICAYSGRHSYDCRLRALSAEDILRQGGDDVVRDRGYPADSSDDLEPRRLHGDGVSLVLQGRRVRCLLQHALLRRVDRDHTQEGGGGDGSGYRRGCQDHQPQSGPVQREAIRRTHLPVGQFERRRYVIHQGKLHFSSVFTRILRQHGKMDPFDGRSTAYQRSLRSH